MIGATPSLLVVKGCSEWSKDSLFDKETYMSTASTEDIATDSLSEDEEALPPMLVLERTTTVTEYNEMSSREWQAPGVVMPYFQSGDYTVPLPPPAVLPPCFQSADCVAPPPPSFSAPFYEAHDAGNDSVNEVVNVAASYAPTYESSQNFSQWHNAYFLEYQFQAAFQEDFTSWPSQDGLQGQEECELSNQLSAGGEQCKQALAALRGQIARLAFTRSGCRIVQQAIRVAGKNDIGEIVAELHGHVYAAARSPYANYVIQKVIEALPLSLSSFVALELFGMAGLIARNKYGCRILCRIFEHSAGEPGSRNLADELLRDAVALSGHTFAHHVIEVILEHGLPEQRQSIVGALLADFWWNAQDQNASYVIASAMVHCAEQELEALVAVILAGSSESIGSLMRGSAGNRVLKAMPKMLAQLSQPLLQALVGKLQAFESVYADCYHGKRLVQEVIGEAKAVLAA